MKDSFLGKVENLTNRECDVLSISESVLKIYEIRCNVVSMGNDYTVTIYGGDKPHVGSTVVAFSRPSLTGNGIGVTSSVINVVGHKDEVIAKMIAETIALKKIA